MARRGSHHSAHEESGSRDRPLLVRTCLDAGIMGVPFVVVVFEDEMPAPQHARDLQAKRRTTSHGTLYRLYEWHDRLKWHGGDRPSEEAKSMPQRCGIDKGHSASAPTAAKRIGCHFRTVEKIKKIRKDGTPEPRRAVRTEEMKINRAYTLIREMQRGKDIRARNSSATFVKAAKILTSEENTGLLKDRGGDVGTCVNMALEMYVRWLREKEDG